MKRFLPYPLAALAISAIVVPLALADTATRSDYTAQVEPICKKNTKANKRILGGTRKMVKKGKLGPAGKRFLRASRIFGTTLRKIAAVPPPAADAARVSRWLKKLGKIKTELRKVGKALKKRHRGAASHQISRLRRDTTNANNVMLGFGFHYCKVSASRFS